MKPVVIVGGALANKAGNGGNAWSRLSWTLGFQQLGFDVCFVEQIRADLCLDAEGRPTSLADSVQAGYFRSVTERHGLAGRSTLLADDGQHVGLTREELAARARGAALLFNLSGHLADPELRDGPRCRVYYDDDPGFTQFWQAQGTGGSRLEGHDFHFTLGANIGTPACDIPTAGIRWRATRPPVVLSEWPGQPPRSFDRFTTVASWRGAFGTVQHGGRTFGQKAHEFRRFADLPRRSPHAFEVALQIHPADQRDADALQAAGWRIVDPVRASHSPAAFRDYVHGSGAEFSVAQGMYVDTHSGWFSDRTVRYLASGRPALVQDSGFGRHLPTGTGLLTFRTLDEAVAGAEQVVRDYPAHCRAARRIAEEHFASDVVIRRLAAEIGLELPEEPA